MNDTTRLTFISSPTTADLEELWRNCFNTQEKLEHINRFVPYKLTEFYQLSGFLSNEHNRYRFWLIKRKMEKDIIGFAIYGSYFPGYSNDVGFNIGLDYIHQGYAIETLNELINFLTLMGSDETFGHCYENNLPAIRTMERCGFVNLGRTGREFFGNHVIELRYLSDRA